MKFAGYLAGAFLVFAQAAAQVSSTVYTFGSTERAEGQISTLDSYQDLDNILYEKLGVDDFVSIDEAEFADLGKVEDSLYVSSDNNGHLVIELNNAGPEINQLFLENGINPVLNIVEKGHVDQDKLFDLLMTKHDDLQVKLNENNIKVISNVVMNRNIQNELNGLDFAKLELFTLSKPVNEKILAQLSLLIKLFFPQNTFGIADELDKTFGYLRLDLDLSSPHNILAIEQTLVRLAKQAATLYGIESTVIVTENTSVKPNQRRSSNKHNAALSKYKSTFASEEECIYSTNNCNTHGLCSKNTVSKKWSCICASSFNKTSKSTTHWSGASCNKIDISAQFNLLFWSSLVTLITVFGAIALIFKMDSEPLPGILNAATSESFKN